MVALVVGIIGIPIAGFLSGSSAAILFSQIFNKVTATIGIKGLGFWFAFVCAGNMGGSLTPLGSITILLAIKILRREGDDISFMFYIKKTFLLTLIHAFMAIGYTFILIAAGL
jgi:Na+/H+ antiporter NhaD/arsenite permease-like protein